MFETTVFLIALGSGIIGALLGIGGGVILVPLLVLFLDIPIKTAVATSLVGVVATSLSASSIYIRQGLTNIRLAMLLEPATTFGAVLGSLTAVWLREDVLALLFSAVAFYTAGAMFTRQPEKIHSPPSCKDPEEDRLNLSSSFIDGSTNETVRYQPVHLVAGFGISVFAGGLSGLLGIGGGLVKVPTMRIIMGLPLKAATSTSSFMVGITATAGAFVYLLRGYVRYDLAALAVFGIFFGARAGAQIACRIRARHLNLVFVIFMFAVAVQMLLKGLGAAG